MRDDALRAVRDEFPFVGYLDPSRDSCYHVVVQTVSHLVPPGDHFLDFGSGPGGKTAILR